MVFLKHSGVCLSSIRDPSSWRRILGTMINDVLGWNWTEKLSVYKITKQWQSLWLLIKGICKFRRAWKRISCLKYQDILLCAGKRTVEMESAFYEPLCRGKYFSLSVSAEMLYLFRETFILPHFFTWNKPFCSLILVHLGYNTLSFCLLRWKWWQSRFSSNVLWWFLSHYHIFSLP